MASEWSRWRVFVYALVPALAAIAAWLSGFIETSSLEYGFPLPWKTLVFERGVCPPSYEIACFLGPALAVYNWSFFALDTAFYIALSYAFVVAGRRAIAKSVSWRTLHLPNWG